MTHHTCQTNTAHNNRSADRLFEIGSQSIAHGTSNPVSIEEQDLNEHFYILGRSGTGKSNLLKELALADAKRGAGLCFIDPIGTTAEELVAALSRSDGTGTMGGTGTKDGRTNTNRVVSRRSDKDIIYFDAADCEHPIGINPLYQVAPQDRARVVSDILQMFAGIWHKTGWGARMESIFRAALHTLVENPHCMRPSLLSVFHLLLDEDFRQTTKSALQNEQVLNWWNFRFDRGDLNERTRREWVEPVLNKIDTLSLDPVIRNIIGQPRCILSFDQIIQRRQILIVNLNQNKIGLDNAAFIGMLILSSIRQSATRYGDPSSPFTITLDEAHSFPTAELTRIINQGRHSSLFARLAHQNLEQFDEDIAANLRNGCGSLAIFAIGSRNAEAIVDDLEHQHRDRCLDLINTLERGQCLLRHTRSGSPQPPSTYPMLVRYQPMAAWNRRARRRLVGALSRTRERFAITKLTAEYQIAFAHKRPTQQDYLHWKSLFRKERRQREQEHARLKGEGQARKKDMAVQQVQLNTNGEGKKGTRCSQLRSDDGLQQIADLVFGKSSGVRNKRRT